MSWWNKKTQPVKEIKIKPTLGKKLTDAYKKKLNNNLIQRLILNEEKIKQISDYSNRKEEIEVDLEKQKITFGNNEFKFEIDSFKKKCLLEGLDDIALSLEKTDKIISFENNLKNLKPWIFND